MHGEKIQRFDLLINIRRCLDPYHQDLVLYTCGCLDDFQTTSKELVDNGPSSEYAVECMMQPKLFVILISSKHSHSYISRPVYHAKYKKRFEHVPVMRTFGRGLP